MKKEIEYMGKYISVKFPSGYYEYYSDKQQRFLTFDCLNDCKESIDNDFFETLEDYINDLELTEEEKENEKE